MQFKKITNLRQHKKTHLNEIDLAKKVSACLGMVIVL